MKTCVACGHQLGLGRFCTNCGHPVEPAARAATPTATDHAPTPAAPPSDPPTPPSAEAPAEPSADWRTETAERAAAQAAAPPPTAPPRVPPSAVTPPPPPRYPLYADEVHGSAPPTEEAPAPVQTEPSVETTGEQDWAQEPDEEYDEVWEDDGRRSWLPWVAGVLLLVVLGVGAWITWDYLQEEPGSAPPGDPQAQSQEPSDSPGPDEVDVAAGATAIAPETAPPSEDVDGELVSYDASNMLDGVPQTAWRVAGDATGMQLTFKLAERTTLTQVGILNGYAKRSEDGEGRRFDWYRGNRRIQAVVWEFGDGTSVRQKLADDRNIQSIDIEPVATRKVVLRLVEVSEPGEGRSARDFTAISEVSLVGQPPA